MAKSDMATGGGGGGLEVIDNGVTLPDGTAAEIGTVFDPVELNVSPVALEFWKSRNLVRERITKPAKKELITKGE